MEFQEFQKIARLSRDIVITEKIDGTNGVIGVEDDGVTMHVGSRSRWLTVENGDNFGLALWALMHRDELLTLGSGYHYGEWWGAGIQRRYGLAEKRFSLFNVTRWADTPPEGKAPRPACCSVVPTLYRGPFDTQAIDLALDSLSRNGSVAAPGFMKPEGVVIFHEQARMLFKKTIEKDEEPKGVRR